MPPLRKNRFQKTGSRTGWIKTRNKTVLTMEEQQMVKNWIVEMQSKGLAVTRSILATFVKIFLDANPRLNPFPENRPGKGFFELFLKRHPDIRLNYFKPANQQISAADIESWFQNFKNTRNSNDIIELIETSEDELEVLPDDQKPSCSVSHATEVAPFYDSTTNVTIAYEYDEPELCRLCMSEAPGNELFEIGSLQADIVQIIQQLLMIELDAFDTSDSICQACLGRLEEMSEYRKRCLSNDEARKRKASQRKQQQIQLTQNAIKSINLLHQASEGESVKAVICMNANGKASVQLEVHAKSKDNPMESEQLMPSTSSVSSAPMVTAPPATPSQPGIPTLLAQPTFYQQSKLREVAILLDAVKVRIEDKEGTSSETTENEAADDEDFKPFTEEEFSEDA